MKFDMTFKDWFVCKKGYSIELVWWDNTSGSRYNNWNIYLHLLDKKLPLYTEMNKKKYRKDYDLCIVPMHGGCTWYEKRKRFIYDRNATIVIGCDYQHGGDEEYREVTDPQYFEKDIEDLIKWVDSYNSNSFKTYENYICTHVKGRGDVYIIECKSLDDVPKVGETVCMCGGFRTVKKVERTETLMGSIYGNSIGLILED